VPCPVADGSTGITAYLCNDDSKLEHAQQIASHADPKTTRLYDRRSNEISLDEVEKIGIFQIKHSGN